MRSVLWKPGKTIRVKMHGSTQKVRDAVRRHASQWTRFANLRLRFVTSGEAEVRVSFEPGGSHSLLGTDATSVSQDQPTMNFGWFTDDTSERTFRRTTLHEFGHALGLGHEHMSPSKPIQWNRPIVIADMRRDQGWSTKDVERNIFRRLDRTTTMASAFDPRSIMAYEVPERWTLDGFSIPYNSELSEMDKVHIGKLYPFPDGGGPTTTTPPAPPPTRRPRPPPTPTRPSTATPRLALMNTARPTGDGRTWRWTAHVHGKDMAQLAQVTYMLHPTFTPNTFTVKRDAGATFPFSTTGWGTFQLRAIAVLQDGRVANLSHQLQFDASIPEPRVERPRPPPPPPPPTRRAGPPQVRLVNTAQPTTREGVWQWTAHLTGPELGEVAGVTYLLHPTFQPNRYDVDRTAGPTFPFTATGWGTFELRAKVRTTDGRSVTLSRQLVFDADLPEPPEVRAETTEVELWLANTARPTGQSNGQGYGIWSWTAYLAGPDRHRVRQVTYKLHPTFNPNRISVDRRAGQDFPLTRTGWGTFRLGATVHLADGSTRELEHDLQFR
jgi:transcription initiation factor IIF auxiliary subunit